MLNTEGKHKTFIACVCQRATGKLLVVVVAVDIADAAVVVTLATLQMRPPKALPAGVWLLLCWLLHMPLLLCLVVVVVDVIVVAAVVVTLANLHLRPPKALPAGVWLMLWLLLPLPMWLLLFCML